MPGDWKRPDSVPYPQIWSRFEGRKEIKGVIPKFWIQDIPEELFGEVADFMCSNYIYEEPLCKFSNIAEDILSIEEGRTVWKMIASEKLGLVCLMENPDPNGKPIIVGVNVTCVKSKDKAFPELAGEKLRLMLKSVSVLYEKKNTFEIIGDDHYLNEIGLSVLPEYRGQGIGEQLLLARTPLCKAVGLKGTVTVFTSSASQKLADRAGFKDIVNMPYEDFEQINPKFILTGISEHTKNIRLMYKIV